VNQDPPAQHSIGNLVAAAQFEGDLF